MEQAQLRMPKDMIRAGTGEMICPMDAIKAFQKMGYDLYHEDISQEMIKRIQTCHSAQRPQDLN